MAEESVSGTVRYPVVSGIFYPEDRDALRSRVAELMDAARTSVPPAGRIRAIVAPHGAFECSGPVAAAAWNACSATPRVDTLVVLSPYHRAVDHAVFLPESSRFTCPLGTMEVDSGAVRGIEECGTGFSRNDIPHLEEHGIEVQIPFAMTLFPGAKLVPVLLGVPSTAAVIALARALGVVFSDRLDRTVFVVSMNLRTSGDASADAGIEAAFDEAVVSRDWRRILGNAMRSGRADGRAGLAAYLASPVSEGLEPIRIATSGVPDPYRADLEYPVGYAAYAFTRKPRPVSPAS